VRFERNDTIFTHPDSHLSAAIEHRGSQRTETFTSSVLLKSVTAHRSSTMLANDAVTADSSPTVLTKNAVTADQLIES